MENMQYELCQVKSKELLLGKKKASKQKNTNETAEVKCHESVLLEMSRHAKHPCIALTSGGNLEEATTAPSTSAEHPC